MERQYDFDLIVIGSGPAGEKGAAQAAYFGKKTAIIEKSPRVGGATVNTGTIPSKTLRETALYYSNLRQRGLQGIDYKIKENITIEDFMYRKSHVVNNEWELIYKNIERHNIELIFGTASVKDPHTVQVELDGTTDTYTAEIILIAVGSFPNRPDNYPIDHQVVYDSDSILEMDSIPHHLVVIGGGTIGCEYATIMSALGIPVTLIESRSRLLSYADAEIAEQLHHYMEDMGITVLLNEVYERIERTNGTAHIHLKSGKVITADKVLVAAGRFGNTKNLGLEKLKIATDEKWRIKVNENFQTTVSNIYAAGDVLGYPALASVAMEQARVAMCHAFKLEYKKRVSPFIPIGVYTIPEISFGGETEESLKAKNIPYCVGRASFELNARGQIIGDLDGMIKLIFSPADQKLLGVHIIGESASELIHLGLFVLSQGMTIDYFIQSVFNFPTLTEAYKYAAYDGLQNLQKMKK